MFTKKEIKTKENIKDVSSAPPLWLPRGSVRSLITLITLGVFFYISIVGIEISQTMNAIVITVVAFYFGSRSSEKTEVYNEQAERIDNTQMKDTSSMNKK